MRTITLRSVNVDNETIIENEVTLEEKDTLVLEMPSHIRYEEASGIHRHVDEQLSSGAKLISLPNGICMKVLKVE